MSELNLDGVKKRLGIIGEFKEFAMRGNVVDLAVGVIIGAAFGKIVTSLVNDILMPPIGVLLGGIDFNDKKYVIVPADASKKVAEVAIRYGSFVNTVVDFIIVAFCIFLVVKGVNAMKK